MRYLIKQLKMIGSKKEKVKETKHQKLTSFAYVT
jgi:hypothetical protein